MFDIGWAEMIVIGAVALLVIGPKELPQALRTAAQVLRYMRKMAGEVQGGLNALVREAELDDMRRHVNSAAPSTIRAKLEEEILPVAELKSAAQDGLPDLKERIAVPVKSDPPTVATPPDKPVS